MFEEHPAFDLPPGETRIWRYLDFTKFVSLLDQRALFFARASCLGDPFEGSITERTAELKEEFFKGFGLPDDKTKTLLDSMAPLERGLPDYTLVNCWHINEHESAGMWSLYLKSDEGIAIRSSVDRLCNCFHEYEGPIYVGGVKYIDFTEDVIPADNFFRRFLHKRKSFEHERELRAVLSMDLPDDLEAFVKGTVDPPTDQGIYVPADIETLVEAVHVSPTAPAWIVGLVDSVRTTYGYDFPVNQSDMLAEPIY